MSDIIIFPARRVITMDPSNPFVEAVAIRDQWIVGVGSIDELQQLGDCTVDNTFKDHVITPGFIEAHSHVMSGGVWAHTYVGFFERRDPTGKVWPGCKTITEVVERLRNAEGVLEADPASDDNTTLIAWGLDPIYLEGERLNGHHLDAASDSRPIFVYHASGHLATVNAELMRREEITAANQTPGIQLGSDGEPTGELQEPAAMSLAATAWKQLRDSHATEQARWNHAYDARNNGHTLVTDLGGARFDDASIDAWSDTTSHPDYPARVMVAATPTPRSSPSDLAGLVAELRDNPTNNKLRFGIVKFLLDGSIQGFTARISSPHYYNPPPGHAENGLWLMAPETIPALLETFHAAGITVHCHCNGDEAAEVFISAVEHAVQRHPNSDHRHTVQHCQLTTPSQYARMADIGMHANIFSNHIFYWGDQHAAFTVGPQRAAQMDACATAEQLGVAFSMHSDSPITPLGHLHVMWCAVNRLTATGEVLGRDERISVETAMKAATINAARQLHLDHEVGSIEPNKFADFAILDADPYEVDPTDLKDIGVWGTVVGGVKFPA